MCGLCGIVGRLPLDRIGAMNSLLAHRGPDDAGEWRDPAAGVALGHRRLSILDLRPEGRQPMENEDGTLRLVFNGEIWNHLALRAELEGKGHRFRSRTDTEVILHLYEEEGAECPRRLDGIFAFALWDGPRRRLLLARDHLGVKPLYWAAPPGGIVFASELKSLLVHPEVPREIDPEAVLAHLSLVWAPAPRTMLRSARKLEPGHRLLADGEGRVLDHSPFWDVPFDGTREPGTFADHASGVRERLLAAVRAQRMGDVPVAAFLSGGVDSTAVVAALARDSREPVVAYTVGFGEGARPDENPEDLPWARLAARHIGADLREVRVVPDVMAFAEEMVWLLDEPLADPACINVLLIAEAARRDGFKVLLSGAGGDDLFSGYRRHWALWTERFWSWIPGPLRRAAGSGSRVAGGGGALRRRAGKYLSGIHLEPAERLLHYFLWADGDVVGGLLGPRLREPLGGSDPLDALRESLRRIPGEPSRLNRMLYLEQKHFLPDHNLAYTDKMGMARGVEVRVPLLDRELVEYAARLPPGDKVRGGRTKAVLKEAVRPLVPAAILDRPKTGFGAPLRRWIREDLRDLVRETLSERSLAARGLFDPRAVASLVEANERREVDASYLVFSLVCIEMWQRRFLDGGGPATEASP